MPVIVVGADTPLGEAVVEALSPRQGELRAFVTDPDRGPGLVEKGFKVAIGDVSDGTHVGGAALAAFCAVLVATAAHDDRERSFAQTPADVVAGWAEGLRDAAVTRAIWIDDGAVPEGRALIGGAVTQVAAIEAEGRSALDVAEEVARLEAAEVLP